MPSSLRPSSARCSRRLRLSRGIAALTAFAVAGCSPSLRERLEPMISADSMGAALRDTVTTGRIASSDVIEASGLAASRAHPGVFYTINDSGNDPVLYATDLRGADVGSWVVSGATNIDWESLAVGPCASAGATPAARPCVYIGDTGDNQARHRNRTIYQLEEPTPAPEARGTVTAAALSYRYPDHARDVEAMYVAPDASVWLVSKRRERAKDGRLRPALLFRLPREAWAGVGDQFAELVDSLPIVPGTALGRQVTDAAISPDGRYVAVRTYSQLYVFAADSASGRIRTGVPPVTCNIAALREEQGEAVTWREPSGPLVLLSEGDHAPLEEGRCSAPE